jgi:hypothetical protein
MTETSDIALRNNEGTSIAVSVGGLRTLQEINERNRQFWSEQSILMQPRMADEDVLSTAMNDIQCEGLRQVPVYNQKSFEEALEIAANAKVRFQRHAAKSFQTAFSKKGGAAPKLDALQTLILEIALKNPRITKTELLADLENRKLRSVVVDIDYELGSIDFNNKNDRQLKSAPISGLKDRLSRAKKKITKEKKDSR